MTSKDSIERNFSPLLMLSSKMPLRKMPAPVEDTMREFLLINLATLREKNLSPDLLSVMSKVLKLEASEKPRKKFEIRIKCIVTNTQK